jgi:hypothetical protein
LQTEEYARQIHLDYQRAIPTPPRLIEERIRVRMLRHEILTVREPPLDLRVVLDESVLLRKVGGDRLMYAQLQHLAGVAGLPNVDLRILPLAVGGTPLNDSFGLMSFGVPAPAGGDTVLHDVVWVESVKSQIYVEGETDTYNFGRVFRALQDAALPPAESKRLIQETAERVWHINPTDGPQ